MIEGAVRGHDADVGAALRAALTEGAAADPGLASFYAARSWRPLFVTEGRLRPEVGQATAVLDRAVDDGLDPAAYHTGALRLALARTMGGDAQALAQAELALARASSAYVRDLHTPPAGARMVRTDPEIPVHAVRPQAVLARLAAAPHLGAGLGELRRMNPIYEAFRARLRAHRAAGGDEAEALRLLANLHRARDIPPDPGRRYIVVDAAQAKLWLFEHGQAVQSMAVIVGQPSMATPMMSGLMRYAVFNPYWNLPEDLVRSRVAAGVLREGHGWLRRQNMEALENWSPDARALDPAEIDWPAVRAGDRYLRVRQRPGPGNTLGKVKLMLPNELGIYLHDTPDTWMFQRQRRTVSAGCVRLEDAPGLTRRLLGPAADSPPQTPEARVDLPQPVPVYITYFTQDWTGVRPRTQDPYGRDPPLVAALRSGPGALALSGASGAL